MKSLILKLLLVLTIFALSVFAAENPVSGIWKVSGSVYGNPVEPTCTLKQEDKKLTGSCKFAEQPESQLTGEINDKKINWQTSVEYNGSPLTLVFSGTLDDKESNMTGKIDVPQMSVSGDFTAKKEAAKSAQ